MRRVLIIGSGGVGKSTFARRLGSALKLEVIHLDAHYWRPGWVPTPKDVWRRKVEELLARDSWIIDGNFGGTLDMRLAACDAVIFLDLPRRVCLWRVIKRIISYRENSRPDMAEGCAERFDLEFLRWVWNYPTRSRPKYIEKLKRLPADKKVFVLDSQSKIESFLKDRSGA